MSDLFDSIASVNAVAPASAIWFLPRSIAASDLLVTNALASALAPSSPMRLTRRFSSTSDALLAYAPASALAPSSPTRFLGESLVSDLLVATSTVSARALAPASLMLFQARSSLVSDSLLATPRACPLAPASLMSLLSSRSLEART